MPDCFGKDFFTIPENSQIVQLLEKSRRAIRIKNETRDEVAELMHQLLVAKGSNRIILLLRILTLIAESKHIKTLCNKETAIECSPAENERINNIYQYILDNYSRNITLEQIAQVAHLAPHSFCRYFISRTKRNIFAVPDRGPRGKCM